MKRYVLHHCPCMDGNGAKFAAWAKYKDEATYIGVDYKQPLPKIEDGSEVYILDFSYPKEVLRELNDRSSKLVVLDHHASAERQLGDEPYAIFDMTQSGAVLAWKYFHPGVQVPRLLKHIQDRDLWQWKMEGTREIYNYLCLCEDVTKWESIMDAPDYMRLEGSAISKYQDREIKFATSEKKVRYCPFFEYKRIALINTTTLHSEIGSAMYADPSIDFCLTWNVEPSGVVSLSFRSDGRVDVSKIAERLGGGGHPKAAGAKVDIEFIKRLYNQ